MGIELRFSTSFHPQTDGQTERTIQILEDMLRMCLIITVFMRVSSRQKSYANQRRRDLEYKVGDHILERLGHVAYRIALPPRMEQMHNVFHVSMLRGYLRDPFHMIDYHQIALDKDMMYEEWPVQIIYRQVKQLRNKTIPMVKVEWRERYGKEATWEKEEEMQQQYPHLFPSEGNLSLENQTF
ncbi:hypothetical protein CsSME_00031630 [Camellia sinensis var. sinensis]